MARSRSPSPPPIRSRLNSKDIPRTYSGQYGYGGELTHQTPNSDLLPFELSRNNNTEWLLTSKTISYLLFTYLFFIVLIQLIVMTVPVIPPFLWITINFSTSWTYTNVLHGIITLLFLHWIKGSPNWYEQGELNAMTLWEQLSSSPDADDNNMVFATAKQVMFMVPTVLCYAACHFGQYEIMLTSVNVVVWLSCIVAKLDWMNGVRLWGINRTIGIDDDLRKSD